MSRLYNEVAGAWADSCYPVGGLLFSPQNIYTSHQAKKA
jgi:hypothetical protein